MLKRTLFYYFLLHALYIASLLSPKLNVHLRKDKKLKPVFKNPFICRSKFILQHRGMDTEEICDQLSPGPASSATNQLKQPAQAAPPYAQHDST